MVSAVRIIHHWLFDESAHSAQPHSQKPHKQEDSNLESCLLRSLSQLLTQSAGEDRDEPSPPLAPTVNMTLEKVLQMDPAAWKGRGSIDDVTHAFHKHRRGLPALH